MKTPTPQISTDIPMAKRFKCKKCKRNFNVKDGREAILQQIAGCDKLTCSLRHTNLSYIPLKAKDAKTDTPAASNDEPDTIVEVYEEQPIGGLISQKEIRKRHGL